MWVLLALSATVVHASPAILVYGDSLSAAYGMSQASGWVNLLQERLRQKRIDYTVANASISGETSSGGASRIARALADHHPAILVLALGANDGLRGLPLEQMRENLAAIIGMAQKSGARVLLVGMRMPPNYGEKYTAGFERSFAQLAGRFRTPLVPFLLEGVSGRRELFQDDNLHPTAQAQPIILENVWKALAPMLARGLKPR